MFQNISTWLSKLYLCRLFHISSVMKISKYERWKLCEMHHQHFRNEILWTVIVIYSKNKFPVEFTQYWLLAVMLCSSTATDNVTVHRSSQVRLRNLLLMIRLEGYSTVSQPLLGHRTCTNGGCPISQCRKLPQKHPWSCILMWFSPKLKANPCKKFHKNHCVTFWVILFADRQTNK